MYEKRLTNFVLERPWVNEDAIGLEDYSPVVVPVPFGVRSHPYNTTMSPECKNIERN